MRVLRTHAREATHGHRNGKAINQLSRHRRQPAAILQSEGIVVIERLHRSRAKQGGSAEVQASDQVDFVDVDGSRYLGLPIMMLVLICLDAVIDGTIKLYIRQCIDI
jgi:hypothetical protein